MEQVTMFVYRVNGQMTHQKPSPGTDYEVAAFFRWVKDSGAIIKQDQGVAPGGWFPSTDPDAHEKAEAYRLAYKQ